MRCQKNPWSSVHNKLMRTWSRNNQSFTDLKCSLLCSHELGSGSCSEPSKSSLRPHTKGRYNKQKTKWYSVSKWLNTTEPVLCIVVEAWSRTSLLMCNFKISDVSCRHGHCIWIQGVITVQFWHTLFWFHSGAKFSTSRKHQWLIH
jgi:hypothetical protein